MKYNLTHEIADIIPIQFRLIAQHMARCRRNSLTGMINPEKVSNMQKTNDQEEMAES